MKERNIKKYNSFFSTKVLNDELVCDFFIRVLRRFNWEINKVADTFYSYGPDSTNDLFEQTERCLLGIFINSVLKVFPVDAIMEEYSVYRKKNIGRADLLIRHYYNNHSVGFLIEAKREIFTGQSYNKTQIRTLFSEPLTQAKKYYNSEKKLFPATTYIIPVIFERVYGEEKVERVKKTIWENSVVDFYSFYHTKNAGLLVYGMVQLVKK